MYYIYRATDVIQTVNEIDSNKALLRVNKRLTGRKKLNWWEWSVRTAAVLFIPLFLFSLYIFYSRTTDVDQYVEVRANPGMTTKVVLRWFGSMVELCVLFKVSGSIHQI